MHGETPKRDAELAILAAKQHGVIAFWQLIKLGFGRGAIEHRLRTKRLHRMYKGVYSVGYPPTTVEAWHMAAVLACGEGAVLSHWTAAARWELLRLGRGWPHVSVPGDRRVKEILTHNVKLDPRECTRRDRIPITTVPRTLLDLAAVAPLRQLQRAINEADRKGRLNRQEIQEVLERNPRRPGTKALRSLIAALDPQTRRTRSDLEVAFLQLCRDHRIPTPISNGKVEGIEVDFHWPGTNLIVELDSYEYHRTPAEFDRDRRRDAELMAKGYVVLRVSEQWLETDPAGVADAVYSLVTSGSIASSE
jgi:very-short-patch-repair endonuclease